MPTLTINGNIRTNTAAGWAADSTVYSAKTILITTDSVYGSTDQRKFKIADGTQTWSQLDYFPVFINVSPNGNNSVDVSDTEAALNGSGGLNNQYASIRANDTNAQMSAGDDSAEGTVNVDEVQTTVYHDSKVRLYAPNVELTSETASRLLILDASKDIRAANTTTHPDLTELSYLKGTTSPIQDQLNAKAAIELMFGTTTTFTPLRLTTYYLTFQTNLVISTTATARQFQGVNLTVFGIWLYVDVQSTLGTTEDVTFNLRNITDATSHLLGTLTFDARGRSKLMDVATPILMNTSKFYSVEMQTPNWGTIPVQNAMLGKLLCR